MQTYTHEYITLADVCERNTLDYDHTLEEVSNSDVSFGTNADTLIHGYMLNAILHLDLDFGDFDDDVLISLGC
jgi:hypothetical protein